MSDVDAIACQKGFTFLLKFNECNYCTVDTIRNLLGHCEIRPDNRNGVLAVVRGTPYLWFPDYPTKCTCKLETDNDNRENA